MGRKNSAKRFSIYIKDKYRYDFQQYETMRSFGDSKMVKLE